MDNIRERVQEGAALLGAALIALGAALIYVPAGLIVGGVMLIAMAVADSYDDSERSDEG